MTTLLTPDDVIELGHVCAGGPEFFPSLLERLRAAFDCDVAAAHVAAAYPVTRGGPLASLGFDAEVRRACARRWFVYLGELQPMAHAAVRGVASDRDAFSAGQRAKKAIYTEFVWPQGDRETHAVYLSLRSRPLAALSLGRRAGAGSSSARVELARLLPALSLAVAASGCGPVGSVRGVHLTPQERQVQRGIEAGLSNPEIALSCGSSVNTVRNQVASLLQKLDLGSRTQLAALGLSAFEERHA